MLIKWLLFVAMSIGRPDIFFKNQNTFNFDKAHQDNMRRKPRIILRLQAYRSFRTLQPSLIITPPTANYLFHSSSFIPMYAKQDKHIS